MANTIANLNVKLSANILGFVTGMRSALKPLGDFGRGIGSISAKVGAFTSLVGGGVSAAALVAFTHRQMEAIDANAKLSDRLGISTEALAGLQHAADLAGVSNDELTGGLQKMLKATSDAATGTPAASAAFQQLGISAGDLATLSPEETLKRIADGLAGVQNPATRAALSMEIFGKSGQSLLPLMMSGAEGIKAAQEEAAKLGLTFSRLDAAKVEAANDSITKLQAMITGAGRTLAIELAPFITAAADKLVSMGTAGEGMGAKVIDAFEWTLTAIAKAADWLELLRASWYGIKTTVLMVAWGWLKEIDLIGGAIVKLINLIPGMSVKWDDTFKTMADSMWQDVSAASWEAEKSINRFMEGTNSKAVTQTFAEIRAKADASAKAIADNASKLNGAAAATEDWGKAFEDAKKRADDISKIITGLQTDLATFGMNDGQKKLFDLKALGADPAQLEQAKRLIESINVKQVAQDVGKAMDQIKGDLATAGMDDVDKKLFDLSKLGATPEQLEQARQMLEQIDAITNKPKTEKGQAPSLMLAGSAEAQKLAYTASIGIKTVTNDVQQRQLAEQRTGNNWLTRIEQNTRGATGSIQAYA